MIAGGAWHLSAPGGRLGALRLVGFPGARAETQLGWVARVHFPSISRVQGLRALDVAKVDARRKLRSSGIRALLQGDDLISGSLNSKLFAFPSVTRPRISRVVEIQT